MQNITAEQCLYRERAEVLAFFLFKMLNHEEIDSDLGPVVTVVSEDPLHWLVDLDGLCFTLESEEAVSQTADNLCRFLESTEEVWCVGWEETDENTG